MHRYQPDYDDDGAVCTSGKDYFYGDEWRDYRFLRHPHWLPRFAHLSRKLLMHYAGDRYNPHTILLADEYLVRVHIQDLINYRIHHRTTGYDWDYIDHFFRKFIGDIYGIDLQPDLQRIEQGIQPPYKGYIHEGNATPN